MHGFMNFEHEFMEMDPALVIARDGFIKQVHEHGFAAPDRPVKIQTLGCRFGWPPRKAKPLAPAGATAGRFICAKRMPERLQFFGRQRLDRVVMEVAITIHVAIGE
jgi:hypothetical protein